LRTHHSSLDLPEKDRLEAIATTAEFFRVDVSGLSRFAIRERLAKSDPGDAGWQRDLSVPYSKLASAFRKGGESAKALDALGQGRVIMERLTKLFPENAAWKRDLGLVR